MRSGCERSGAVSGLPCVPAQRHCVTNALIQKVFTALFLAKGARRSWITYLETDIRWLIDSGSIFAELAADEPRVVAAYFQLCRRSLGLVAQGTSKLCHIPAAAVDGAIARVTTSLSTRAIAEHAVCEVVANEAVQCLFCLAFLPSVTALQMHQTAAHGMLGGTSVLEWIRSIFARCVFCASSTGVRWWNMRISAAHVTLT